MTFSSSLFGAQKDQTQLGTLGQLYINAFINAVSTFAKHARVDWRHLHSLLHPNLGSTYLVGGFNLSEKYRSIGIICASRGAFLELIFHSIPSSSSSLNIFGSWNPPRQASNIRQRDSTPSTYFSRERTGR